MPLEETDSREYDKESVLNLMSQESLGLHVSLIENGTDDKTGKPKMSIVLESDMNSQLVKDIMWGLLEQYEEVEND